MTPAWHEDVQGCSGLPKDLSAGPCRPEHSLTGGPHGWWPRSRDPHWPYGMHCGIGCQNRLISRKLRLALALWDCHGKTSGNPPGRKIPVHAPVASGSVRPLHAPPPGSTAGPPPLLSTPRRPPASTAGTPRPLAGFQQLHLVGAEAVGLHRRTQSALGAAHPQSATIFGVGGKLGPTVPPAGPWRPLHRRLFGPLRGPSEAHI